MTTKTPTIELVHNAVVLPDDPATGTVVDLGAYADDTTNFNLTGLDAITYDTFDVYEDGVPMANGRTFQATCSGSVNTTTTPLLLDGPYWDTPQYDRMPGISFGSMNIPVIYITDDNVYTCFFRDDPVNPDVAFMKGRFVLGGYGAAGSAATLALSALPPYMIPAILTAATVAGTVLDIGYTSDYINWNLASNATDVVGAGTAAPIPMPYSASSTIAGDTVILNGRPAIGQHGFGVAPDIGITGFGLPGYGHLYVKDSSARAMRRGVVAYPLDLRTYRRMDASATYDWYGTWSVPP